MPDDTLRALIERIESLAGRRASERPYMSPEERLAQIEEFAGTLVDMLDAAAFSGPSSPFGYRLVDDPQEEA